MDISNRDIRIILLYEFKLGTSATETVRKLCSVFDSDVMSIRTAQFWFNKFRSGDMCLENKPRSGRPVTIDNDVLRRKIDENPSLTCEKLAEDLNVSDETIRRHLHNIGKVRKLNKWVPYELSMANKLNRITMCEWLLSRHKNDPFVKRLLTSDEKWVTYDNSRCGYSWLDPGSSSQATPKPSIHSKKLLLCVWWNGHGIIHYELLKPGQTVTAELYVEQLDRVQEQLTIKCPAIVNRKGVVYLHDNARPHVAKIVREKLKQLDWEVLPHPPYSPDLAPSDYHLFLSMSNFLANKKFENYDDVKSALDEFFDSKDVEFYRNGLIKLIERWKKCIDSDGAYFD